MRRHALYLLVLLIAASLSIGQSLPTVATVTLVGRSGKPLAGARILLAEIVREEDYPQARLKLLSVEAVTDKQGRCQLKGFAPGTYALLYQPAGGSRVLPVDMSIKTVGAGVKSTMPLLKGIEIGKGEATPPRDWGRQFTLLKGHTFLSQGELMKIWNATLRRNPGGPCLEVRKGALVTATLADKSDLKFEAWSY